MLTHLNISFVKQRLFMKHWKRQTYDPALAAQLQAQLNLHVLIAQLLVQRGVQDTVSAQQFLQPDFSQLHDPFLMRDMDRAICRLQTAIDHKQRILLYGDYDVDGVTSVALMFSFLSSFYTNVDYYIPNRDKEGYGVSLVGVEYAKAHHCQLIIAMDCGVKAYRAVDLAHSYGIDMIVCDHHLPDAVLPSAYAVLDPKRPDCPYPFKELSGCGIAFKLAQALALQHGMPVEELEHLLDLVALSIACDLVPMIGENRCLTYYGLQRINQQPRLGIWALINKSGRQYPLTINDLVFGLGPMINAAGRLADAKEAVKVLLATDRNHAIDAAGQLTKRNHERQVSDQSAYLSAKSLLSSDMAYRHRKSIVLFDPNWHKGIVGITASRLSEQFHRPTVVFTASDGRAVGSARSIDGFDLYEGLRECEHLFSSFGGHAHAAGIQMPLQHLDAFTELFEQVVARHWQIEMESPIIEYCADINLKDITNDFWQCLQRFAPFGPGNMNPVFRITNLKDTGKSKLLANNHVRLSLQQGDGPIFTGVAFGLSDVFQTLRHRPFEAVFNLRQEYWQGHPLLSLMIKDLR
jgi:single-stranded-DNA-specific exonuclease